MAAPAPPRQPISIAKPGQSSRTGGVLPVGPANKIRTANGVTPSSKNPSPRLKVVVRRLAPGLTESEFYAALGEEWRETAGKVDWASYKAGKISKDAAKPSRPSRAYLHLKKEEYLPALSDKVRETSFLDSKGSANDSSLLGPPSVEFAPYWRVPISKARKDGRQGTIDQDPEFIDFLESLTNPVPKPTPIDAGSDKENKEEERIVTPLIQYLRDKKANKGKESTTPSKVLKHSRQDSKEPKSSQTDRKAAGKGNKEASAGAEKRSAQNVKVEKIAKDAAKALNKQANAVNGKASIAATPASAQEFSTKAQTPTTATLPSSKPERRRERGNASAAAKILQRDLGLGGAPVGRRRREGTAASSATSIQAVTESTGQASTVPATVILPTSAVTSAPTTPSVIPKSPNSTPSQPIQPPTGPAVARTQPKVSQTARSQQATDVASPTISPGATQAFLKHANPSQGVTESLLDEAFSAFGRVTKVEIDKKKGFAYVDFADSSGLQKAIAASPVKVAQGHVVVLERKTGASLQNRNARVGGAAAAGRGGMTPNSRGGRGNGGRGRGGKAAANAAKASLTNDSASPEAAASCQS